MAYFLLLDWLADDGHRYGPRLVGERLQTGQRRLETRRYGVVPYARFGTLFFHPWMTQRRGHEGWSMWETNAYEMDAVLRNRSGWR